MKITRTLLALSVAASVAAARAEDEAADESGNTADAAEVSAPKAAAKVSFTTLPMCKRAEGVAEVCLPGGEWKSVEEGKFYPLGASFRAGKNGQLKLAFGPEASAEIKGGSEFATRAQPLGDATRTISLVRGTVELKLADNLPEGAFVVSAPGFVVENPAGESRYIYADMGDGCKVTVRCITGSLSVKGRHFHIPAMRSADEVVIRTSRDFLSTFLYGTSGDYAVKLEQGMRTKDEIGDDGQVTKVVENGVTEWRLSPTTKVIINRALPAIGERMSVHTMAFDAAGERKSECYFCEGRAEINSGELVVKEKVSEEDLAKVASEAAETTKATDVEDGEADDADKSEDKNDSSSDDEF